jgi:hypothetical protein
MLLRSHQQRYVLIWSAVRYVAVVIALFLPVSHVATLIHLASEPHAGFVPLVHVTEDVADGHGNHSPHHHHHHHGHHHGHGHSHQHDHNGDNRGSEGEPDSSHHQSHPASDHLASFFYLTSPCVVAPGGAVDGETAVLFPPERIFSTAVESALRPRGPPSGYQLIIQRTETLTA